MNQQCRILCNLIGEKADKGEFNIYPMVTHCALDIICETTMGVTVNAQNDENSEYVRAVYKASELVYKRMITPWLFSDWIYNRTASGIQWNKTLSILKGFTKKVIQERRNGLANHQ